MTRVFAADLELYCLIAMTVAGLACVVTNTRIRLDVIRGDRATAGYEMGAKYGVRQLLRMHKLLFKSSWTRWLYYISSGICLLALIQYMVLALNDSSFVDNRLLHLIPKGR